MLGILPDFRHWCLSYVVALLHHFSMNSKFLRCFANGKRFQSFIHLIHGWFSIQLIKSIVSMASMETRFSLVYNSEFCVTHHSSAVLGLELFLV